MNPRTLSCEDENEIKELLMFRKIVEVKGDTLILDDGTELIVHANGGCGGCSKGNYYIVELNNCDNIITNVEFDSEILDDNDSEYDELSFKIFVYTENRKLTVLRVDGTYGGLDYGDGYWINVKEQN